MPTSFSSKDDMHLPHSSGIPLVGGVGIGRGGLPLSGVKEAMPGLSNLPNFGMGKEGMHVPGLPPALGPGKEGDYDRGFGAMCILRSISRISLESQTKLLERFHPTLQICTTLHPQLALQVTFHTRECSFSVDSLLHWQAIKMPCPFIVSSRVFVIGSHISSSFSAGNELFEIYRFQVCISPEWYQHRTAPKTRIYIIITINIITTNNSRSSSINNSSSSRRRRHHHQHSTMI